MQPLASATPNFKDTRGSEAKTFENGIMPRHSDFHMGTAVRVDCLCCENGIVFLFGYIGSATPIKEIRR